ncbi:MAG: glutamate--tRNA ligase family protein [Ilumatobacteraceae bacterium]
MPDGFYPGTCRTLTAAQRAAHRREGRPAALRLDAGGMEVAVHDECFGEYRGVVDDVVLRRNDGVPAYNLAVVVDDAAQGVDEVCRGDDLLESSPRQAALQQLLGLPTPRWIHLPLVLGPDGSRLAKRHGAVTLGELVAGGYRPADVVAWAAETMGLSDPGESCTFEGLVARFDLARLDRRAVRVDGTDPLRTWQHVEP